MKLVIALLLTLPLFGQGVTKPRTKQIAPSSATTGVSVLVFSPAGGLVLATLDASLTLDMTIPTAPVLRVVPPGTSGQVVFVDAEVPSGIKDGVNKIFILTRVPTPQSSLVLTRNGIVLQAGSDYILVGPQINFVPEATPQGPSPGNMADSIVAWYRTTGP